MTELQPSRRLSRGKILPMGVVLRDPEGRALVVIALFLVVVGTVFYHFVEGWQLIDALYFCVTTLTTVGFGDLAPQTTLGRAFTIPYVIVGVGLMIALVSMLAHVRVHQGLNPPRPMDHGPGAHGP
ncbi:MAG: potassium channel family protein [Pirellulales bacterium]